MYEYQKSGLREAVVLVPPLFGTGTRRANYLEMAEFMPFLLERAPIQKGIHILSRKHLQNGS